MTDIRVDKYRYLQIHILLFIIIIITSVADPDWIQKSKN